MIKADVLQKQRAGLRKVAGPPQNNVKQDQENVASRPTTKHPEPKNNAASNLILQRLKDRKAMMAEEHTEDQLTRWSQASPMKPV